MQPDDLDPRALPVEAGDLRMPKMAVRREHVRQRCAGRLVERRHRHLPLALVRQAPRLITGEGLPGRDRQQRHRRRKALLDQEPQPLPALDGIGLAGRIAVAERDVARRRQGEIAKGPLLAGRALADEQDIRIDLGDLGRDRLHLCPGQRLHLGNALATLRPRCPLELGQGVGSMLDVPRGQLERRHQGAPRGSFEPLGQPPAAEAARTCSSP